MPSRRNDFLLGLATICFLALFLGTILFLYPSFRKGQTRIVVHFRHDEGIAPLKPGGQVLLSGALQIGTITDVRAEEIVNQKLSEPGTELMIVVEAEIRDDIRLHGNCAIASDQPMVGGPGFLVILNVGSPDVPRNADQPIRGLPPQSLAAAISTLSRRVLAPNGFVDKLEAMLDQEKEGSLTHKLAAILTDINAMTGELRTQLDPSEQTALLAKIHIMLEDVGMMIAALREQTAAGDSSSMLSKLHGALDKITEMLTETTMLVRENRPTIREALVNVEEVSRSLREELVAAMRAELNRDDPTSLLGKVHGSMDALNTSLADVGTITAEGRRMLIANRPAIDRTLANVKETSEQLRLASIEIRLMPWRLMAQPTKRESAEFDIFEAARTFAEAATYLDDAAARLEAVLAATPPGERGAAAEAEIQAIHASVKSAFERFERAEKFLWERMK